MSKASDFAYFASNPLSFPQYKNYIINGNFDIWQRGLSQTGVGYGSADRWRQSHIGTNCTVTQQSFNVGQIEVPGNPKYFYRNVVSSVAGAGNYAVFTQTVESIFRSSGKKMVLSFWAKSDANRNICVESFQYYGSNSSVAGLYDVGICSEICALTNYWKKFEIPIEYPIANKSTIGTDGDDWFTVQFWLDAGSNLNARLNNLGQQSGTFDFAQIQLEEGTQATDFEIRHIDEELRLCQRYFEKSYAPLQLPGTIANSSFLIIYEHTSGNYGHARPTGQLFKIRKRAFPTMTWYSTVTGAAGKFRRSISGVQSDVDAWTHSITSRGFTTWNTASSGLVSLGDYATAHWTADAEIN